MAGAITPVPGGVGPMTIACLLKNTLRRRGRGADCPCSGAISGVSDRRPLYPDLRAIRRMSCRSDRGEQAHRVGEISPRACAEIRRGWVRLAVCRIGLRSATRVI